MINKKLMAAICCFSLCAASLSLVSGCSSQQKGTGKETKAAQEIQNTETTALPQDESKSEKTPAPETEANEIQSQTTEAQMAGTDEKTAAGAQGDTDAQQELKLYISLGGEDFQTYPYTGEGTPAGLVQGIANLTGWNLTLADEIYSGKGGMSVIFSSEASIFTGPPENQTDEFHVYDSEQMAYAILDSIQKTLQNYASSVNPDSVDIWYSMEGEQPLTIDSLGVTLPIDQPYSHEALSALLGNGR